MALTQASRTALMPGFFRAQHQSVDADPKILVDPVAAQLLDDPNLPGDVTWLATLPSAMADCFRSTFVIRSGVTEQYLQEAVARGTRQYLILGAGLDTFGFRQPAWAKDLQIREVDHPLTQAYKLERIKNAKLTVPGNLEFIAVDFTQETMADGLARTGFDRSQPVFASWLGCAMYLTRDAILQSMRPLSAWPGGAELCGSFIAKDWSEFDSDQKTLLEIGRDGAASIGEPWLTIETEMETAAILRQAGFKTARRIQPAEIEKRCGFPRKDSLRRPFEMLFYAASA